MSVKKYCGMMLNAKGEICQPTDPHFRIPWFPQEARYRYFSYIDEYLPQLIGMSAIDFVMKASTVIPPCLEGMTIEGHNFCMEKLQDSSFRRCRLVDCNFSDCNMDMSSFKFATIKNCDFTGAHLIGCNFQDSTLIRCKFDNACVNKSDFRSCHIMHCSSDGMQFRNVVGNGDSVKTIICEGWNVCIIDEKMSIGCQTHSLKEWWDFSDAEIANMDPGASSWWKKWKPILRSILDDNS